MWTCSLFTGLHLTYPRNLFTCSGQRWKHSLKAGKPRVLESLVSTLNFFGIYSLTLKFHQLLTRLSLTHNVSNQNSSVSVLLKVLDLLHSHHLDTLGQRVTINNTLRRHGQISEQTTISIISQENIIRVNHKLC